MANFSVITVARRRNDPPFNPYVYVVLSEHFKESTGNIMLSAKLMSEFEIDEAIHLLAKQLEKARDKAKKELQKAKEQNRIISG
jgi:hypothetical protein